MKIDVSIERLVVRGTGLGPPHAAAVGEAVVRELSRLLAAAPARSWQRSRRERRVAARWPGTSPGAGADGVGRAVARSVYGGIRGSSR